MAVREETRKHNNILRALSWCLLRSRIERVSDESPAHHDDRGKAHLSSPQKAGQLMPHSARENGGPSQRTAGLLKKCFLGCSAEIRVGQNLSAENLILTGIPQNEFRAPEFSRARCWSLVSSPSKKCKTDSEPVQATRGSRQRRRIYRTGEESLNCGHVMTFLRSLSALLLALNTAAAQGSSSQPSFFLQDPSDGESGLCV